LQTVGEVQVDPDESDGTKSDGTCLLCVDLVTNGGTNDLRMNFCPLQWRTLVPLLAAGGVFIEVTVRAGTLQWAQRDGYREAALTVQATGRPGFTLLRPDQTGILFTNTLSYERAEANQNLLNGCGVAAGAVANTGSADFQAQPSRLTAERTLLVSSPYFAFEKIDLPSDSTWRLRVEPETWLLVITGSARAGSFDLTIGDAVFMQSDRADIHVGADGLTGLLTYAGGGQAPHLLEPIEKAAR
jgi:hypothetical protein